MNCPNCGNLAASDDVFCNNCGATLSQQSIAATPAAGGGPPVQHGSYRAEISLQCPGCLIFLVDQSGSMEEPIAGGNGEKKMQIVADTINRLLYNRVLSCAREDGIRPYYDVGVWSYGGVDDVQSAFPGGLISITELANKPKRTDVRRRRVPDTAGGIFEEQFELPVWLEPAANGEPRMSAAFRAILAQLQAWLRRHPDSFPPVVVNLIDGANADDNPRSIAWQIMQLGTSDGNVLVFNCHIANPAAPAMVFPNEQTASGLSGLARTLFDISSPIPGPMYRHAFAMGHSIDPGARGLLFNGDQVTTIDFLDIGTHVIQDRVEVA